MQNKPPSFNRYSVSPRKHLKSPPIANPTTTPYSYTEVDKNDSKKFERK